MTKEFIIKIIRLLDEHKVEYVITGGVAEILRGIDKTTLDIDILSIPNSDNIISLNHFIESLTNQRIDISKDFNQDKIIRIKTFPFPIDILPRLDGLSNEEVFQNAERVLMGDVVIPVISERDLVKNYNSF